MKKMSDILLECIKHEDFENYKDLKDILIKITMDNSKDLDSIGDTLVNFTSSYQSKSKRKLFFSSWYPTYNNVMSVEGLASRISLLGQKFMSKDMKRSLHYFNSAAYINRLTDEDLSVIGGTVSHPELYKRMASGLTGNTNEWMDRGYCVKEAIEFKTWRDDMHLRAPILEGLYALLINEATAHAEFEFANPLLESWAEKYCGLSHSEARHLVTWTRVHTMGTEQRHFGYAILAIHYYQKASEEKICDKSIYAIMGKYIKYKAHVMRLIDQSILSNKNSSIMM